MPAVPTVAARSGPPTRRRSLSSPHQNSSLPRSSANWRGARTMKLIEAANEAEPSADCSSVEAARAALEPACTLGKHQASWTKGGARERLSSPGALRSTRSTGECPREGGGCA